ncbi:uncharacterized protein HD556DRAFT_1531193 [Suillus plorans]|uniref:F-box domain-containing protein n=1 Tax=Suillus plorans TaxID=116603 RepID=A0A9P7ABQ5_9AGAM|nr:uncharacterized protein HD556DRAFT_1531193 [Suillus plorans]KAG1786072.1 hypothetical protein HD556DRAFT_1531193 [Suillus plorans]
MKPQTGFLSLAEELLSYILSFLPHRDILRCTSVCRTLRQTYLSSSELQYIVEINGQQLLVISNPDNSIPISKRLQRLRDEAHAWFKVDTRPFLKMVPVTRTALLREIIVAGGYFCSWDRLGDTAMIFPVHPKPSQQSIRRNWLPGTLCSVPHSRKFDVFMDPAQNLIAVAYAADHNTVYINLGALDGDGVHPEAAGETLFLSDDSRSVTRKTRLKGFGRHIALSRRLNDENNSVWQLHIWDWKYSTTSSSILSGAVLDRPGPIEFCFLGNNRLLVIADNLNLYSIENMSQTPEFLACFLIPIPSMLLQCLPMIDDIGYDSQLHMQAQATMCTSDPTHRLICLITRCARDNLALIISTRIFFDLDEMAAAMPIPWEHWGPSNTRILQRPSHSTINGNRVLQTLHVGAHNRQFILQLLDFSPLAATNARGLGRVVKEPSTTCIIVDRIGTRGESLTTSLPYVQVAFSHRKFGAHALLRDIWIDKDRIYMLSRSRSIDRLEVIDVRSDLPSDVVSTG